MQSITIVALLALIAVPIFAEFDHLRARRDSEALIESSGEGSGVEGSGAEGSGIEGSGEANLEASGESSGLEASGDSLEGSGFSSDSQKDVKTLTDNEFAVSV